MTKPAKPLTNGAPFFPPRWRVFPVKAGAKEPAIYGWASEATDSRLQIEQWWKQFPNCNWAVATGPSGLAVIDIDGEAGEQSLFAFELDHEALPPTREQNTPHGRHLIFSGDIKPTVGALGPNLDTRGGNSYIVVAPSVVDGIPYILNDAPIASLPAFVSEAAGPQHERKLAAPGTILDTQANRARAKAYLNGLVEAGDVAIEGSGGDARTFALAAEIMDRFALSPDGALEVMQDWNAACQPSWDYDQLQVKVDNASRYAQNEPGANAVPPVEERIPAEALDRLKAESEASAPTLEAQSALEEDRYEWRFETFNAAEDANLPPITYHDENKLWPKIPGGSLTQIIAQAKGYKTTFYLSELFRLVARELKAASE